MQNKRVKRIILIVVAALGLALAAPLALSATGRSRFAAVHEVPLQALEISGDGTAVARGEHLVTAVAHCGSCHGPGLAGTHFVNSPRGEGVIVAPNLTAGQGGLGADYSPTDWVRTLHHGVRPDGRSVLIMPSQFFNALSAEDLAAVIAYLQTIPPVDNVLPPSRPGPLLYLLLGAGPLREAQSALHIDQAAPFAAAPPEEPTAAYGAYLATIGQCQVCHGPELAGGQANRNAPIGPNLTPGGELGDWSEADFLTLMRSGREPNGREINPAMPWRFFRNMTAVELRALWAFLQAQPALEDRLAPQE